MVYTIGSGVTCYAVPRDEWDKGEFEKAVIHKVKDGLVFGPEHVLCGPDNPDAAGLWRPYALTGWYGFARGGTWVILVKSREVHSSGA